MFGQKASGSRTAAASSSNGQKAPSRVAKLWLWRRARSRAELRRWSSLCFGFASQTGLGPDVNGHVSADVLLAPASPLHQELPQLVVRPDPQHGVDPVFIEHHVPCGLVDVPAHQLEIIVQ